MMKTLALAGVATLAITASGLAAAAGAPAAFHEGPAAAPIAEISTWPVLYDQTGTDSGIGIVSQNFESLYASYDSRAADDFTVPAGAIWKVKAVDVTGVYFNGIGPAVSEHVTIYKNHNPTNLPGMVLADFDNLAGIDNGTGSFHIRLPQTVSLRAGTYWISVQVNMDFGSGGEWGWESMTTAAGNLAVWENPGNAFGTGCMTWTTETTCIPDGQGDHLFRLRGVAR